MSAFDRRPLYIVASVERRVLRRFWKMRRTKSWKNGRSAIRRSRFFSRTMRTTAESTFGRGQNTCGPSFRSSSTRPCDWHQTDKEP